MSVKIAPSMMCADFIALGAQLDLMREEGVDCLHVDIMDGHYVPNYTLGPDFCRALAAHCPLPLDVHLMIENLDAHAPLFARLPNCVVTIHPEACWHPLRTIDLIVSCGAKAGIAVDPAVPLAAVQELLPHVSWDNIPRMIAAGADVLVAGSSSLFDGAADLRSNIRRMKALIGRR